MSAVDRASSNYFKTNTRKGKHRTSVNYLYKFKLDGDIFRWFFWISFISLRRC